MKNKVLISLALVISFSLLINTQDRKLTLNTPINKSITTWEPSHLEISFERNTVTVYVKANTGEVKGHTYVDIPAVPEIKNENGVIIQVAVPANPIATNIINAINPELRRAILMRLRADGIIGAGTIGGLN